MNVGSLSGKWNNITMLKPIKSISIIMIMLLTFVASCDERKEHIASAAEITDKNSAVVSHIFEVAAKIAREKQLDGFRIVNNCGDSAGQTVKHLHFHMMSGRDFGWPAG